MFELSRFRTFWFAAATAAALTFALVASVVGVPVAHAATAPDCTTPPTTGAWFFKELDKQIIAGTSRKFNFSGVGDSGDSEPGNAAIVSFEPVAGGTITYPTVTTLPTAWNSSSMSLRFAIGDSPGVVKLSRVHFGSVGSSYAPCRSLTYSAQIDPVEPDAVFGGKPAIGSWLGKPKLDTARFSFAPTLCGDGVIEYRLKFKRRTFTLPGAAGCALPNSNRSRAFGFLNISSRSATDEYDTDSAVAVSSTLRRKFKRRISYAVMFNGALVRSGGFTISRKYHRRIRGYKVYDSNFDDFVNICINQGLNTYAEGGRLYCFVSGESPWWETDVRKVT